MRAFVKCTGIDKRNILSCIYNIQQILYNEAIQFEKMKNFKM